MVQKITNDYDILVGLTSITVRFQCQEGAIDVPFPLTPEEAEIVELRNGAADAVRQRRRKTD